MYHFRLIDPSCESDQDHPTDCPTIGRALTEIDEAVEFVDQQTKTPYNSRTLENLKTGSMLCIEFHNTDTYIEIVRN